MPQATAPDAPWVDIVPPASPAPQGEPSSVLFAAVVLTLLAIGVVLYLRARPGARAHRRLRRLIGELQRGGVDARSACLRTEQCLRRGWRIRRLEAAPVAAAQRADWEGYLGRLRHCRFAAEAPPLDDVRRLAEEAIRWLPARRKSS